MGNEPMEDRNAYAVLGLRKGVSEQEIKQAYIELVKKYDPEKHTERFMVIQSAYRRLQDVKRRAKEDIFTFNPPRGEFQFLREEQIEATEEMRLREAVPKAEGRLREGGAGGGEARTQLVSLYMQRSFLSVRKKLWAEAIRDWSQILQIETGNVRAKNNLIFAYNTLGHSYALHTLLEEAAELWEKALQMDPDNSDIIHNLAIAYEKLASKDKAQKYWSETVRRWKTLLDKNPEEEYLKNLIIEVHRYHGGAFESAPSSTAGGAAGAPPAPPTKEQKASAIQQYRELLKYNPNDFDAQYQIGQALMEEQKWDESAVELEKLSRAHPKNVEVLNLLGWALLNSGQVDNAFHNWRRALALDPKNFATKDTLVRAHLSLGKKLREGGLFTPALVHFKQLLRYLGNESPEVHMELGITYDMKGDIRSAIAEYNLVLQLDPKNKLARKAISELKMKH